MRYRLLLIVLLIWVPPAVSLADSAALMQGEVEEIMGMYVHQRGIAFQVYSGGCTTKDDFTLNVLESNPVQLLLVRDTPDPCDAYLPYGRVIGFSYAELGLPEGQEFIIINPHRVMTVVQR
ncbi:MAG: hypothetical protein U9Q81_19525 [Pseudomonadota bacterium]|nr:hypothetical protein [Pseudomonadota bacterium]